MISLVEDDGGGGVGILAGIENKQPIDFFEMSQTQETAKLRPTGT